MAFFQQVLNFNGGEYPAPAGEIAANALGEEAGASPSGTSHKPRVSPPLVTLAAWSWRALVVAAAGAAFLWLLLKFSVIVISVLVTLLLAVVLQPFASFLHRRLFFPKPLAAGVMVLAFLAFITALLVGSGTGLYQGFTALSGKIRDGAATVVAWLIDTFPQLQDKIDHAWQSVQGFLADNGGQIAGGLMTVSNSVSAFATAVLLVIFSLFYFLADGRHLWQWFVRLWPENYRTNVNEAGIRGWVTLEGYVRNQTIAALFDAVLFSVLAAFLHTPVSLVFPIGALVFLLAYIPIVGLLVGTVIAALVVLVNTGSFVLALIMLVGASIVGQIEGNVLSPLLQGKTLNLHAWAILLLVMGGSAIAGVAGALFTVPLAAAVNTMVLYLRGHDTYPYLNTMPNRPGGPPQDFSEYTKAHWRMFDREIAQHLSPRAARAERRAKRAKKRAAAAQKKKSE